MYRGSRDGGCPRLTVTSVCDTRSVCTAVPLDELDPQRYLPPGSPCVSPVCLPVGPSELEVIVHPLGIVRFHHTIGKTGWGRSSRVAWIVDRQKKEPVSYTSRTNERTNEQSNNSNHHPHRSISLLSVKVDYRNQSHFDSTLLDTIVVRS